MDSRDKEEHPLLQDIWCCGLHVVRGTLHNGVVASSWANGKVLQAMFKFLHKSSKRAEYLRVRSSGLYPEKFCATQWVENESIANQAIEIWGGIVALIKLFVA